MRWALSILMVLACLGCQRPFDTSKGLEIHHRSCKSFASTTRNLLLKRTRQQDRPEPAKFARLDLHTATNVGSMPPNVVSMVSNNFAQYTLLFSRPYRYCNIFSAW